MGFGFEGRLKFDLGRRLGLGLSRWRFGGGRVCVFVIRFFRIGELFVVNVVLF